MQEQQTVSPKFPQKLKMLRQNRNLSQGQIALKIGADPQRISKYERGLLFPTTELALKLADLFEVSLDYLLRDEKDMANCKIRNAELLNKMEEIERLPSEKQKILMALLDAFIKQNKLEEMMNS